MNFSHQFVIKKATTSKRIQIFIGDSSVTTGAGLTGLVYNSASLVAYYFRDGDSSPTAITLATATVGTWTSGGFKEISSSNMPGWYELDLPDAVLATGTNNATVHLKGATNMRPCSIQIDLVSYDPNDSVRLGLTALPNAAFGATGGVASTIIRASTAQAGAAGTITLDASASATNDLYNDCLILTTGGTGASQVRRITDYVGSTKVASVTPNWITTPDATTTFAILPAGYSILASDALSTVVVESGVTLPQAIAIIGSKLAGKRSGMATSTNTYKGLDNTTTRIVETTDSDGNATAVTLTLP